MTIEMLEAMTPEDVAPLEIGPGCFRRDLPGPAGARLWIVDREPGAQWPYVDVHGDQGERMPSQVEEVVVLPHVGKAEDLAPEPGDDSGQS